jgi:RND family efflux transporter MFP subunit
LDAEGHRIALEQATASIQRIDALIRNQRLTLKRYDELVAQLSTSQSQLDQAKTDLDVLSADLAVAKSRLSEVQYRLSKTRILSPVKGAVQERMVAVGDYVKEGDPLFKVIATDRLQARLYFPEVLARRISVGLSVRLEIGCEDSEGDACFLETEISHVRPMLDATNRSLTALAQFPAEERLRPGSSLMAHVVLKRVESAVLVPERSLVRRPAGTVVYRIQGDRAVQIPVQTGLRDEDWVQIRASLTGGERIALDGAGFLTDGATVVIRDAR